MKKRNLFVLTITLFSMFLVGNKQDNLPDYKNPSLSIYQSGWFGRTKRLEEMLLA